MDTQNLEQARLIGEIHGLVKAMREEQVAQGADLRSMDSRLREQETTAAKHGAIYGSAVAVGIALIIEGAKQWLRGGPNGGAS